MIKKKLLFAIIFFLIIVVNTNAEELFKGLRQKKLPNGLTVLLLKDISQPVVAVQIWVKTGVINETSANNGISHFTEHMLFKGTTSRPVNAIQQEIESKGGILNGATSKDFTYYHIILPAQYWEEALLVLADMVQNANFDKVEFEKERQVVLQEIRRQNDEPDDYLWNVFNHQIFKESPYKMPTLGTAQTLNSLTPEIMKDYYEQYYRPQFLTVVVAGDFPTTKVLKKIKQLFPQKTGSTSLSVPSSIMEKNDKSLAQNIELPFQADLIYQVIGFLGPAIEDADGYILDVVAAILGQGQSSRLNQILREDKRLVFSINSGFLSQKNNGLFIVSSIYSPAKIPEVKPEILTHIHQLAQTEISDEELSKAKKMLTANFMLENQTVAAKASTLGFYATVGNIEMARNYAAQINKVQKKDIKRVVGKYLLGNYTSVLLAPGKAELP